MIHNKHNIYQQITDHIITAILSITNISRSRKEWTYNNQMYKYNIYSMYIKSLFPVAPGHGWNSTMQSQKAAYLYLQ